jgi:hypothetical protein
VLKRPHGKINLNSCQAPDEHGRLKLTGQENASVGSIDELRDEY